MNFEYSDFENVLETASQAIGEQVAAIRDKLFEAEGSEETFLVAQASTADDMARIEESWAEEEEPTVNYDVECVVANPELQELVDAAPNLNEYEALLLTHMDGLSEISADVLPSLLRLLPAIQSGNLEKIGDSPDFPVLLQALREGVIQNEELRTDMLELLSNWLQDLAVDSVKTYTGEAVPQEVLNTLATDIDHLLTNPENQITLLNIVLDEEVLPKIISGEDLDWQTEAAILNALGRKGYELVNLNHLGATLSHFWDGVTTEVATDLFWHTVDGSESEEEEETEEETEEDSTVAIPDFLANPENADKLAQFFEENEEQLLAAGKDLPVLYLAARAVFNKDFQNPAIKALADNGSLGAMMTELRVFVDQEPEFREGILEQSEKGVVAALKLLAPGEERDWEAIEEEVRGIISASPELQADYLDFVFLQFDKEATLEALQGNIDPLSIAREILGIPFIHNLANQLGDKEATPHLRQVLTEIGINAGFNYANKTLEGNNDWHRLQAELRELADNPRIQDALFGLLEEDDASELIEGVQRIMAGETVEGADRLLQNEHVRVILGELRKFVAETDETEKYLLDAAVDQAGRLLHSAYPQLASGALIGSLRQLAVENDVVRESLLQLALDPDKIRAVTSIASYVSSQNLGETIAALRSIPELNIILDHLTDALGQEQGAGEALRTSLSRTALTYVEQNVGFFQTPRGQELFQRAKPQLEGFLRDSDVLQQAVAIATTPEGAQALVAIVDNATNPEQALSIVNSTPGLRDLTEEVLGFVQTNAEVQALCLDYACSTDERLVPVQEFFGRNPEALGSLVDLACDLGSLEELAKLLGPLVAEEDVPYSAMLVSVSKLAAYPGLQSFVDTFTQDLRDNPDDWQETVAFGVDQVTQGLKEAVREKMKDTFGEACLAKIDKALDSVGEMLVYDLEIRGQLIDFATNPENLHQLADLVAEFEKDQIDPVRVINLMGGNPQLLAVMDNVTTVLLSSPEVRLAVTEMAIDYMDTYKIDETEEGSSEIDVEAVLVALMSNKDLRSILDGAVDQVSSDKWDTSRDRLFTKGTEVALRMAKTLLEEKGIKLDERWDTVASRLSKLIGSNENIQQSILSLSTDLEAMQAFLSFGEGGDFSMLQHPEIRSIVGEAGGLFSKDAETWDLLKNTAFDSAYDKALVDPPFGLTFSEDKREDLRVATVGDLRPGVFDVDKFVTIAETATDMEGRGKIGTALRSKKIAKVLRLSVGKILSAYL